MRTTAPSTFQVPANKVTEEARKKIQDWRGKIAALEAEPGSGMLGYANALQSSTKGVDERKREGSVNRRSSQYEEKSIRWSWRGQDDRTQNKLRVEVSKAKAQLVRHSHKGQVRFEQTTYCGRNKRPRKFEIFWWRSAPCHDQDGCQRQYTRRW